MSYNAYIALKGFKETPIPLDAWLAAARQCDDVVVEEEKNRYGEIYHSVTLKGDKRARLALSPYGLIHAQNPSRDLVMAMFKLADALNAAVYSERLKRFSSVDDWERCTRKYRHSLDEHRARYRKDRRFRIALWMLLVAVSAALGWFKGGW